MIWRQSTAPKSKEDSFATPKSKTTATNSLDKKRSSHKWLKPLDFTPIRELNLLSSAAKRKIDSSHIDGNHPEASKDCPTPFKTPIMVPCPLLESSCFKVCFSAMFAETVCYCRFVRNHQL